MNAKAKCLSWVIILIFCWADNAHTQVYETGCGNDGQDRPGAGDSVGSNPINPNRACVGREVVDLQTFGNVPVEFKRYYVSRHRDYTQPKWELGASSIWQHNWNYELRESSGVTNGFKHMIVRYPEGLEYYFYAADPSGSIRVPEASWGDRLYPWSGAQLGFTLVTPEGREYDFKKIASNKYNLTQIRNGQGGYWNLTYDVNNRLTKIQNNFTRWITINRQQINGIWCITSITSSDGRNIQYQYGIWSATGDNILTNVIYPEGENAAYTYVGRYSLTNGLPLLATASDPSYGVDKAEGDGARIKYVYNYNATSPPPYGLTVGVVLDERNLLTDQLIVSLPLGAGNYPQILEGDGTELTRKYQNGLIKEIWDGEGRKTIYTRTVNGYGYIASETHPNGGITYYGRDYAGRILFQTNALGGVKSYTYNTDGFILTQSDELGRVTTYQRDAGNRPILKTYPDGSYEEWTYNPYGQILTHRKRNGGIESFGYYGSNQVGGLFGDLRTCTNASGSVTKYSHDNAGRIIAIENALGYKTTYFYNWRGQITKELYPDNSFIGYQYDFFGNKIAFTNEMGHVTKYNYNEYNRLKSTIDPLNRSNQYEYGIMPGLTNSAYKATITCITYPSAKRTEYKYDASGLRIKTIKGAGTADAIKITYQYDSAGRLQYIYPPMGGAWVYNYDLLNRCFKQTDPLGYFTEWTYDAVNNLITEEKTDGSTITYLYNSLNKRTNIINALGEITEFTYNDSDLISKIIDANGNIYNFKYNLENCLTHIIYPNNTQELFSYDAIGNLSILTNRTGQSMKCSYDNRNHPIFYDWNDALTSDVIKTYDLVGRILVVSNANSIINYIYDMAGQLVSEQQLLVGGNGTKSNIYQYTDDGLRKYLKYPGGVPVKYYYNGRNQLKEISYKGDPLDTIFYNFNENRSVRLLANGMIIYYDYLFGRQLIQTEYDNGANFQFSEKYGYDLINNIRTIQRSDGTIDRYLYDLNQQIEIADSYRKPIGLPYIINYYDYDSLGNRSKITINTNTIVYSNNNLNQYINIGNQNLSYNINGNLTNYVGWQYIYDAQDRLIQATTAGTNMVFFYDGMDRCVKQLFNGVAVYRYYDGQNLIEERDANNNLLGAYVHDNEANELVALIEPSGNKIYYQEDGMGNVSFLSDNSSSLIEKYVYDTFGFPTILNSSNQVLINSAYNNRFLFNNKEYWSQLGLYNYHCKIYSPILGRFMQPDSAQFKLGNANLYRYHGNNPIIKKTNTIEPKP